MAALSTSSTLMPTLSDIVDEKGNVSTNFTRKRVPISNISDELLLTFYSLIFVLAVVGNSLVIVTLIQNKRMRTVTNVLLLNLSISDLLLAVFCMPFTLTGYLLRNFIFGPVICPMIFYLQAVSVGVNVITLVAISLERYFAICQPLRSRRWQTLSHSYKIIVASWISSGLCMIPIVIHTRLIELTNGSHKCREVWTDSVFEMFFSVFLILVLLLIPCLVMFLAYCMISWTLWKGIRMDMKSQAEAAEAKNMNSNYQDEEYEMTVDEEDEYSPSKNTLMTNGRMTRRQKSRSNMPTVRCTQSEKTLAAKKRVIKMLFAVVLEFFICWTPLYVMNSWELFDYKTAHEHISPTGKNFVNLLSYVSTCCNPITYCFMNKKFRQGFIAAFRCCSRRRSGVSRKTSDYSYSQTNNSRTAGKLLTRMHRVLREFFANSVHVDTKSQPR
ncbi:cholecystokinin receptor type A-like [Tubulanus polymorphus]|uniref:cholecystokinin receptor type A-like n=1 Tax=Tubulanus polymorphus TaxID=672921 RepID=UPI003DA40A8F